MIKFHKVLEDTKKMELLNIPVGINLNTGHPVKIDLKESHILITGITGYGKSSIVNIIFASCFLQSEETRLIYVNPLSINNKKQFPKFVEEVGEAEITDFLKRELKRVKALYDNAKNYTILVLDEISLICDNAENTSIVETIAKTGRHSKYILVCITQYPTLKSFGKSSLIKQNLHYQIIFRLGDSQRGSHSIISQDIPSHLLRNRGEAYLRTPKTIDPLHIQTFFLSTTEMMELFKDIQPTQEEQTESSLIIPTGITKGELEIVLNYLQTERAISQRDIRRLLNCQHEKAKTITDFLTEKGILKPPASKMDKFKLFNDLQDKPQWFLSGFNDKPQSKETTNIIDLNHYKQQFNRS